MKLIIHAEGSPLRAVTRSLRSTRPLITRATAAMASSAQRKLQSGKWVANSALTSAVKGSSKPLQDRGQLLASQTYRVESDTKGIVGYSHPGAGILHNGGTIRPKRAKFLTIPAGRKTRSLMRTYGFSPRACMDGMKAAGYRVWPIFGLRGNPIICASKGKGKPFTLFILKKSVRIPARPWTRPDETDRTMLRAMMARYSRGAL